MTVTKRIIHKNADGTIIMADIGAMAANVQEDGSHRFVSDAEKTTWNGKASAAVATQSANGLMATVDKVKLDGVASGANNYTHPSGSGNNHVPSGGGAGKYLKWSTDGVATWGIGTPGATGEKGDRGEKGDKGDTGMVSDTIDGSFTIGTRKTGSIVGERSFAQGVDCAATGRSSHAEGQGTVASNDNAHAEGAVTIANGAASHAEGDSTRANGYFAHAEGQGTVASAFRSHAEGSGTTASGDCSHAGGHQTVADVIFGTAIGSNNKPMIGNAGYPNGIQDLFVIGNGIDVPSSNAFRVSSDGAVYALKQYNASGADYAEYFEWIDGNPENEDRVGRFVTFSDGDTIKIADDGDYILGISSGNPCVIGNADEDWIQRWSRDEFGRMILNKVPAVDMETKEAVKDDNGVIIMRDALVQNPEYDPEQLYVQRKDRKEWEAVGMMGVLPIRDDGTCQVNGYCKCADGGIATTADRGAYTYRVIGRVTDNIIKVVLK